MGVVGSIPARRRPSEISAGNRLHTTPIWLAQLQQGQRLRKGCELWSPTWQRELGWAQMPGRGLDFSESAHRR